MFKTGPAQAPFIAPFFVCLVNFVVKWILSWFSHLVAFAGGVDHQVDLLGCGRAGLDPPSENQSARPHQSSKQAKRFPYSLVPHRNAKMADEWNPFS